MANAIRALTMDAVQAANSGHPGAHRWGMADVATVLFNRYLTSGSFCRSQAGPTVTALS